MTAIERIFHSGITEYEPCWRAMQAYTQTRNETHVDQLWLVEHAPVYTLGLAGKTEHLLQATDIPLVKIDRGGQITYHGPGQAVVYVLVNLHRRKLKVRELVFLMEQAIIDCLAQYGLQGSRQTGAPGVYINDAKIAALGLRVSRGCSYHGLALNVGMDLAPFSAINPCGYAGLRTTQLTDHGVTSTVAKTQNDLADVLTNLLNAQYPAYLTAA